MENFADRYRGAAFLALFLGTLALAVVIVFPFLPAMLWALMLSILMFPLYSKFATAFERGRWSKKSADSWASGLTTLITFLIICVPFVLIGIFLYIQIASLLGSFGLQGPNGMNQVVVQLDKNINSSLDRFHLPHLDLSAYMSQHSTDVVRTVQQPVSHAFGKIAFTGLSLVIALLTMFFMLRDGERLREPAHELLPLPPEKTEAILKKVGETVYAVFIGTVLVAVIQAVILSIGFGFAKVPHAFLFGIMALFLCTIPLIGATVVYVPVIAILAAQGQYGWAIGILCIGIAVTKLDYFLRPLLIGNRSSLHPIGIFFGILGGVLVFGPVGLVAGPMVLAVLLALQDVVRERVRGSSEEAKSIQITSVERLQASNQ